MSEQAPPFPVLGRVFPRAKDHILAGGKRSRLERACRLGRSPIGMDTHLAEILAETCLEERARRGLDTLMA